MATLAFPWSHRLQSIIFVSFGAAHGAMPSTLKVTISLAQKAVTPSVLPMVLLSVAPAVELSALPPTKTLGAAHGANALSVDHGVILGATRVYTISADHGATLSVTSGGTFGAPTVSLSAAPAVKLSALPRQQPRRCSRRKRPQCCRSTTCNFPWRQRPQRC